MARYWDWFGDGRLAVTDLGLACCVVEFQAASAGRTALPEPPDGAEIAVVVAGTVTDAVAPLVRDLVAAQPRKPRVLAFGACACVGGPYWDSTVVTKGVDQLVAVDRYVPGCPPTPQALTEALEGL